MYEESFHIQLHKAGFSFITLFIELVFFVPVSWNGGDIVTRRVRNVRTQMPALDTCEAKYLPCALCFRELRRGWKRSGRLSCLY